MHLGAYSGTQAPKCPPIPPKCPPACPNMPPWVPKCPPACPKGWPGAKFSPHMPAKTCAWALKCLPLYLNNCPVTIDKSHVDLKKIFKSILIDNIY